MRPDGVPMSAYPYMSPEVLIDDDADRRISARIYIRSDACYTGS